MLLSMEVSRKVKILLAYRRRRPSTSLEFVILPADPVVSASPLVLRHRAVDFDHGALGKSDVLLFCQRTERAGVDAGDVRCEDDARTCGVDAVCWVADAADAWDVGATAAADDGVLEMFPEASLVVEGDFAGLLVVEPVDSAGEQRCILRHGVPEADAAEWYGYDGIVDFHGFWLQVEEVVIVAMLNCDFLCGLVVRHTLD